MVAVKHKQYIFGDDFIIRDAITGACTPGPQLPSDTYLSVQLAASDSHVVLVSATPQVVFGDPDSPGDVIVHVLAVDEAGMPQGEWQRLLPRRWTGLVSLLAHEGGLWHLIGRWAQGTQGRGGGGGGRGRGRGRRGSERLRYRWDRQMASFDPRTLQWIQEDEEEEEEGEGDDDPLFGQGMMHGDMDAAAPFGGGDNNESDSTHAVEIDYGEGPGGCHKQLLLQAASACEVLRHRQQTLGPDLLALQGEDLQWEMRGLLTRGPQPLVADGQGREQGGRGGEKGKAKEGVLINEENVVRVMASGGTGLFSIIGDQMMIVPVAANGEYLTGPGDCVSEKLATDATSAQSVSSRKGGMLCLLRRGRDMVVWENGLSRVLEAPILWGDQIPGGAFVMSI
ncbi:hypothetical protein CLOM_g9923 [Closterium sp. NIES-68]|nr:hypothetical protein CLOM_g9923 [Closterium sp. NIES-68]GJP64284.1 hypothetical protein CLOP_g21296 [Closterium sp. NIES-67]